MTTYTTSFDNNVDSFLTPKPAMPVEKPASLTIEKLSVALSPESFQNVIQFKAFGGDAILMNINTGLTYSGERNKEQGRGSFRELTFNVPDGEYVLDTAGGPRNPTNRRQLTFNVNCGEVSA